MNFQVHFLQVRNIPECKNIRVASVSPGLVDTEFIPVMYKDTPEKAEAMIKGAAGGPLLADDIAENVKHILSLPKHAQINDILIRPTQQAN